MCTSNVTAGCPTLVREAFTADVRDSFASRSLCVESCSLLPNYTIILYERRDERDRETAALRQADDTHRLTKYTVVRESIRSLLETFYVYIRYIFVCNYVYIHVYITKHSEISLTL